MTLDIRYYKHALIINNTNDGFLSISTFWTPKDKVEALIDEENMKKVLVIGQLYTYEGLKFIQYNTCANPQIQYIIVTGFDNNHILPRIKSQERGTLDYPDYDDLWWNYWGQRDDDNADNEMEISTVPGCSMMGHLIFLDNYEHINNLLTVLVKPKSTIERTPVIIPPPKKSEFDTLDSEKTGFVVRDSNLYRLWKQGLMRIKKFGTMVDGTRELMNIVSVLTSEPILHPEFPAVEQAEQYLPQVCNNEPTEGLVYTYGSRLHQFGQIDEIINSLSNGLFNRNGVSTTWQPQKEYGNDYYHPPPCLVLVTFRIHPISLNSKIATNNEFKEYLKTCKQFVVNDEMDYKPKSFVSPAETKKEKSKSSISCDSKITIDDENENEYTHVLYVNSVFRSHDYMKGFPMNIWGIWYLGQKVINEIQKRIGNGVRIKHGPLTNLSIAAHVYEQDFKKLEQTPMINTGLDPRGYFTITLLKSDNKIRVGYINSNNKEIEAWESDNVNELSNLIQIYISDISHALYMGRELMRAKQCLITGDEYIQN